MKTRCEVIIYRRTPSLEKGGWQVHMKGATPRANGAFRKDDGLPEKSAEPKSGEFHCEMTELCQLIHAFLLVNFAQSNYGVVGPD